MTQTLSVVFSRITTQTQHEAFHCVCETVQVKVTRKPKMEAEREVSGGTVEGQERLKTGSRITSP